MNILDENILESQRQLLIKWRVRFRQIGYDTGRKGMDDDEIIPFLFTLRQPTLFTMDADFFKSGLCHARYGLAYLDVNDLEAAAFIRRLLRHRQFDTHAKRMGVVLRISYAGVDAWRSRAEEQERFDWEH